MKWPVRIGTVLALMLVMLAVAFGVTAAQSAGSAQLRLAHAIPGAPGVDVYTDGQLTASNLAFGESTTYAQVSAGDHQITVTAAGSNSPLWQQNISAPDGSALTLVAASSGTPSFLVFPDDLNPLPLGKARLTALHAIPGAPAVDLLLTDGRLVIPGLQFGQPSATLDVPTFVYDFAVVPAGGRPSAALLTANGVALASGASYMLVVYGKADDPQVMVLAQATAAESASAGLVRVMHGVSGAPAVDVYLNGILLVPSLGFTLYTPHIAVPAGAYDLAVRVANSNTDLLTASVEVASGQALTIAALGTPDEITPAVFSDEVAGILPTEARISLINGIPGGGALDAVLSDGSVLAEGLIFGEAASAVSLTPSALNITAVVNDTSTTSAELAFYGGVYYNVLALEIAGETQFVVAPTSLTQGIASAPGAIISVAIEPTPAPTVEPPPVVEPTPVPAPAAVPTLPQTAPQTATGPTGRVFNLDADRNLQLRQYPNSNALSLGTVPPGTILLVNGREGALAEIPFSATPAPPPDYQYVDPASQLTDKQDLDPAATWLNVTYITPDGGQITAWANALYLDVRNPRGERIRLASLPTVAANLPGEVESTAVAPPAVPANVVAAIVFNLNEGVNLNIRRTADANGEVLARVPNTTVMEFRGISEDRQWVFVRYTTPQGGVVTGWVNATYIQYAYNNRAIDLEEMEKRSLLVITPLETRGDVSAGVAPAGIPTANPIKNAYVAEVVLNPGSNLNMRRNPDINSEVLAQIPSGTRVIVTGRSPDSLWLFVEFEGIEGWIAAQTDTAVFVRVTFNGRAAQIADIPAITDTGVIVAPTPTEQFTRLAVRVTDAVVAMTGSPGGNNDGLPILSAGMIADLLFTDGLFSYIELPDGTRGWVPAGAVQPR